MVLCFLEVLCYTVFLLFYRSGRGRDALSLSKLGLKLKGVFKSQTGE